MFDRVMNTLHDAFTIMNRRVNSRQQNTGMDGYLMAYENVPLYYLANSAQTVCNFYMLQTASSAN